MSGADKDRLARRAVAAMGGWQTGMVEAGGAVVAWVRDDEVVAWATDGDHISDLMETDEDDLPNLDSPATQGCLFARVRELHGVTEAEAVGYILDLMVTRACGYAEALVIGLEAGR